jgi:hypothetical protein
VARYSSNHFKVAGKVSAIEPRIPSGAIQLEALPGFGHLEDSFTLVVSGPGHVIFAK